MEQFRSMEKLSLALQWEIGQYSNIVYPTDVAVIKDNYERCLYRIAETDSVQRMRVYLTLFPKMPIIKRVLNNYIDFFVINKSIECARYLLLEGFPIETMVGVSIAIKVANTGSIELMTLLLARMKYIDEGVISNIISRSIEANWSEMVKLVLPFYRKRCCNRGKCTGQRTDPCYSEMDEEENQDGRLCRRRGCKLHYCKHVESAVKNGSVDCLKLLLDAGCVSNCTFDAAKKGNLQCMKLLLAANARIEESAVFWAVNRGDYAMVKLLIKYNCPKIPDMVKIAKKKKYSECLNLLLANGFPYEE